MAEIIPFNRRRTRATGAAIGCASIRDAVRYQFWIHHDGATTGGDDGFPECADRGERWE
jgi:hypothetical protein